MESVMERMLDFVVDPETPVEAIRAVLDHAPEFLIIEMARSPRTPMRLLETLAHPHERLDRLDIMRVLIENENMPLHLLESLSWDARVSIRCYVARCGRTPTAVLERFLFDDNASVRSALLDNRRLPPQVLERLRNDPSRWVRERVERHRLRTAKISKVY